MPLDIFCNSTARFVSDLFGNPEDRFSHNEAHNKPTLIILLIVIIESHHVKTEFLHICENKYAITAQLISAFVFAIRIVQSFYLNPKFQVSSHLLWLYIWVCVGHPKTGFLTTRLNLNRVLL